MLSGLLITIDILVCIALVGVVLMQRSEGGGFVSGGPSGLVTARGAGNLLTRATWVLFVLFLVISVSLTLLGAHDRATSKILQSLKLQQANPNALSQPAPAANALAPLTAPQPQGPLSAPAPAPETAAPAAAAAAPAVAAPAAAAHRATHERKPAAAQPAAPNLEAPAPQPAPSLEAPPPQPAPATQP